MGLDEIGLDEDLAMLAADRGMLALLLFWARHWQENGGTAPTRAQMDPCELPRPILPVMFIYERLGDRLRCRLAGTRMRDLYGIDGTGLFLDQMVQGSAAPGRSALFHRCLDGGLPLLFRGFLVPSSKGGWRGFSRLLLPVAKRPGEPATQVMGMVRVFDPPAGAQALARADADGLVSARLLNDADCRALTPGPVRQT